MIGKIAPAVLDCMAMNQPTEDPDIKGVALSPQECEACADIAAKHGISQKMAEQVYRRQKKIFLDKKAGETQSHSVNR